MSNKYVQTNNFYLAGSGVVVGATSIVLTSFSDIYGNVLTMTDFGSKGYITFEPDTTNEESATFTGVTANANLTYTLTGVSTALAKSPYTETSGLVRQHSGGTKVCVSDTTAFWNTFANKNNDEIVTGTWTFNNFPITPGNPNASSTVIGVTKLSVNPVSSINPIALGVNDPKVPTADPTTLFAPIGVSGKTADVQVFTTSGTWTKPANAKLVKAICVGAGGGGGGGGKQSGQGYFGGSGGGGGGVSIIEIQPSLAGATETVTVGVAGTGGAGTVVNNGTGGNGVSGTDSSFGTWVKGYGGKLGAGGSGFGTVPGGSGGGYMLATVNTTAISGQGAQSNVSAAQGAEYGGATGGGNDSNGGGSSIFGAAGGGGGANDGGSGVAGYAGGTTGTIISGGGGTGGAGTNSGSAGGAGSPNSTTKKGYGGDGGGAGGSTTTATGFAGGAGGLPGGGGGGGGATATGTFSGAGGAGAGGQVMVITFF